MSKKRMRRRMRRRKGRGGRTEFRIKFSELDRTLLFCYFSLPFPFLSLCLSVAPLDCAHLSSRFSHSVRTRSFTSPARRCTFFSNPFLRYSTALNGRLRTDANSLLGDVPLRSFFDSTINLSVARSLPVVISALCWAKLSKIMTLDKWSKDLDLDWFYLNDFIIWSFPLAFFTPVWKINIFNVF